MKKTKSLTKLMVVTATISSVLFSASSFAEEQTGPYIKLGANYFNFDSDRAIENEHDYYLGGGYQFSDHWGVEYEYTDIISKTDFGSKYYFDVGTVNAIYRHQPRGDNSLFWKMGAGKTSGSSNSADTTAGRLGIGYDFSISDSLSWQVGADALFSKKESNQDLIGYVGLSYFFGPAKSEPVIVTRPEPVKHVPVDTDNDGVFDMNDQCPNTAPNTKVDTTGCDIDLDKDGVINTLDKCPNTPLGAKVDALGCRIILTEDVSIRLNVLFANNSDVVTKQFHDELSKIATFMSEYPDTHVVIEGHTDSLGKADYNQQLSQKRAAAVMQYLVTHLNVAKSRISSVGKGEAFPIADNKTNEGRAINRRVHAEIKTKISKLQ